MRCSWSLRPIFGVRGGEMDRHPIDATSSRVPACTIDPETSAWYLNVLPHIQPHATEVCKLIDDTRTDPKQDKLLPLSYCKFQKYIGCSECREAGTCKCTHAHDNVSINKWYSIFLLLFLSLVAHRVWQWCHRPHKGRVRLLCLRSTLSSTL